MIKPKTIMALLVLGIVASGCLSERILEGEIIDVSNQPIPTGPVATAPWTVCMSNEESNSEFTAVTHDAAGNTYAVGWIANNKPFDFGNGVVVTAPVENTVHAVLVKYNAQGQALWARTAVSGVDTGGGSVHYGVGVDAAGNVYVAGDVNSTQDFGTGNLNVDNGYLMKYNADGVIQWVRSFNSSGGTYQYVTGLAVDAAGNAYVPVTVRDENTYTFGEGTVSFTGVNYGENGVLVKFNSQGTVQWAKGSSAGYDFSEFNAVAVDSAGNAYVAGSIMGGTQFTFGTHDVTGLGSSYNALIVKYDSAGTAQMVKIPTATSNYSRFYSIAVDTGGNIIATGDAKTGMGINFGSGNVTPAGAQYNFAPVVVKYSAAGTALWTATTTDASPTTSTLQPRIAVEGTGDIYLSLKNNDNGGLNFGTGMVSGASASDNGFLVKYNAAGVTQWVKTTTVADAWNGFLGVSVDSLGQVCVAGSGGKGNFNFGNGVNVSVSTTNTANMGLFLIRY